MATMKDVSELAGVSAATVSRVINGSDKVVEETRARVRWAMEHLGYKPNSAAQSLASNRSNSIGMVVSWLDGPFYGPMMAGVEDALRPAQKHLLIASGHGSEDLERDAVDYLLSRGVDGLILVTERLGGEYLARLSQKLPVYVVNQFMAALPDHTISIDNELGAYMATRHLLAAGHRKIVCTTGETYKMDGIERVRGYRRAMQEFGIDVPESWIGSTIFQLRGGYDAIAKIEARNVEYTAVVCGNDEQAFGVMEFLREHGRRVPEDVSVVGFDDIATTQYVNPKLTTIHVPIYDMAKAAAELALAEIYKGTPPKSPIFEPRLIMRDTVQALRTESE